MAQAAANQAQRWTARVPASHGPQGSAVAKAMADTRGPSTIRPRDDSLCGKNNPVERMLMGG